MTAAQHREPPVGTRPDGCVHMIPGGPTHRAITRRLDLPAVALCGKVWWPDWDAAPDDVDEGEPCQECADRRALLEAEWDAAGVPTEPETADDQVLADVLRRFLADPEPYVSVGTLYSPLEFVVDGRVTITDQERDALVRLGGRDGSA